jgi:hypothetical protein
VRGRRIGRCGHIGRAPVHGPHLRCGRRPDLFLDELDDDLDDQHRRVARVVAWVGVERVVGVDRLRWLGLERLGRLGWLRLVLRRRQPFERRRLERRRVGWLDGGELGLRQRRRGTGFGVLPAEPRRLLAPADFARAEHADRRALRH